MTEFFQNWKPLIYNLSIIIGAGIIGIIIHLIVFRILSRISRRTSSVVDDSFVKHTRRPLKYIMILLAINIALPTLQLSQGFSYILNSLFRSMFIISVSWLIICLTVVAEDVILSRYNINVTDNLQARKIYTQTQIIRKILAVVIIILAVALILMGFDSFRQLGTGILASAGLATLVIGLAAQKIFGNFLAGIQIAFTQPIRIDDVVIVENEWGKIEEITLTYVVVRIWDLRRLVLPISYFIEKPFQNWTKVSADLLGTVFIYTDYTIPVKEVREELNRILKSSDKWDGKVCGLQITDAKEHTMELRALMSAADSSKAWDLRCEVREKLIEFIQKKYPDALPKTRAEFKKTEGV
ncbi:MAG: mechanosensitive ion channel [Dehalococcoidales bacterium]|nr:mechanosensitive ion channel [Dehalococcoidales bacterium]